MLQVDKIVGMGAPEDFVSKLEEVAGAALSLVHLPLTVQPAMPQCHNQACLKKRGRHRSFKSQQLRWLA